MINSRRQFLKQTCGSAACLAGLHLAGEAEAGLPGHTARWYRKLSHKRAECLLCPHECCVEDKERGTCGVRANHGGELRTLVYGRPCAINVDPIEKKPFFHLMPGTWTFSIATAGCNLKCKGCQNWRISQSRPEQVRSYELPPARVVEATKKSSSRIISYTYTEPVVFLEYVIDTAALAREAKIRNCIVTGGHVQVGPLKEALKVLDAVKVDLKSFSDATYMKMSKGHLKPILRAIETVKRSGTWLEIVYLVIPTVNDDEREVRRMCQWVKRSVGKEVPVHFTRFHPDFQLKHLPPTPYSTLRRCFDIARAEGLLFPYVGNIAGKGGEDTLCPKCRKRLIERVGFSVRSNDLRGGACPHCKTRIPGVWS